MNKGFGYIFFIGFLGILLVIISSTTLIIGRERQKLRLDQDMIQAQALAYSGIRWYKKNHTPLQYQTNNGKITVAIIKGRVYSSGQKGQSQISYEYIQGEIIPWQD